MMPSDGVRWLFWDDDFEDLDCDRDADHIIPRVLELGRLADVRWLLETYTPERVLRFLREVGHPELSPRTIGFWRAYFRAEGEAWAESTPWRRNNDAFWPG